MARQPRLLAAGLLYHVIARGNHRELIFLSEGDYGAYLARLVTYQRRYAVRLYAYCLMPNHVHLLSETSESPLSKFMQSVQQSYTQWFNRTHGKSGHLFQGRYKAIICDRDEYLAALVRYIHLNPVRAGLVEHPDAYPYSGHRSYVTDDGPGIIDPRPVLALLGGRHAYRDFVLAGAELGHQPTYYQTQGEHFLGARNAQRTGQSAAQPARTVPGTSLEVDVRRLAGRLGLDANKLRGPARTSALKSARAAMIFTLVRRLGYRVADVADALGRDASTISEILSTLPATASVDTAALMSDSEDSNV
jgi:putative transposase